MKAHAIQTGTKQTSLEIIIPSLKEISLYTSKRKPVLKVLSIN